MKNLDLSMLEMVGRYVEVEEHRSHLFDGSSEYLVILSEEGVVEGMVTGSFDDIYPEMYIVVDLKTGLQQFIDESLLTPLDRIFGEDSNLRGKEVMIATQYENLSFDVVKNGNLPHGFTKGTIGIVGGVLPVFSENGMTEERAYFIYAESDIRKGAHAQFLGKNDFTLL